MKLAPFDIDLKGKLYASIKNPLVLNFTKKQEKQSRKSFNQALDGIEMFQELLTKIETGVMGDTVLYKKGRTRLLPVSMSRLSQIIEKINPNDVNFFKHIPDKKISRLQSYLLK